MANLENLRVATQNESNEVNATANEMKMFSMETRFLRAMPLGAIATLDCRVAKEEKGALMTVEAELRVPTVRKDAVSDQVTVQIISTCTSLWRREHTSMSNQMISSAKPTGHDKNMKCKSKL